MKTTSVIVPQIEIPQDGLPHWEQFSLERQEELIQALAGLLLHQPPLQALTEQMCDERPS